MIDLSEDKQIQKTTEVNKIFLLPEETMTNLTKLMTNLTQDFQLSKLIEILNKSAIIGRLEEFLQNLYKTKENQVVSQNNLITQAFTYILINKFNPDYSLPILTEEHALIKEITKHLLENLLLDIKCNNEEKLNKIQISLKLVLLNLLLLKFKYSVLIYDLSEKIISIKSYFKENPHINQTISEFLSIYLEINTRTSPSDQSGNVKDLQAINFIFSNSSLFKSLIEDCNNGRNINECELKVFYDHINKREEEAINETIDAKLDDRVLLFDRHLNYKKKIHEIISMDLGSNFLFYGNPSSCKTTFAKIFTKDEIVIDVDETIEVNNLLGGYLINEFSEIIWQDGLLIKALVTGKDLIIRNMEKCSNELLFILKQIVEKNSVFLNLKQEHVSFAKMPKIFFIYNLDVGENLLNSTDMILNLLISNTFHFRFESYSDPEKIQIALHRLPLFKKIDEQQHVLETIIDTYNKVVKKYKFNTRFRELNLTDLIKFAERVEMMLNELNIIGVTNYSFSLGHNGQNNPIFLSERNKMKILSTFIFLVFYTLDDSNLIKLISIDYANSFNFDANTFSNLTVNFMEIFSNADSNLIKGFENEKITFDQLTNISGNMYSYNSNSKFYTKLINESVLNEFKENVLLVGETGVGKTTMIQNLAKVMNTKLNVINLSQSSDVSELFGGFKPIHPKVFLKKYFEKILNIIQKNFSANNNRNFINSFYDAYQNKEIEFFIKFSLKSIEKIEAKIKNSTDKALKEEVESIKIELMKFKTSMKRGCYNAFTYIDGILLDAIKKDEWILLDEINLASDDLLLKLCPILEGEKVYLVENNELVAFERGPKFRIFGSMNPEYNIGKKRLPHQLRSQFSEIFVHEIKEFHDIKTFVKTYLHDICCDEKYLTEIAKFYMFIKDKQGKIEIQKLNGAKCNFSLRNLSRTLITIRNAVKFYDIQTAISEAINMNFMSLLNESSMVLIKCNFFTLNLCGESNRMNRNSIKLNHKNNEAITNSYFNFNNYFIKKEFINSELIHSDIDQKFILTKTFKNHLNNLMRIVTLSDYAVLLEGPTSVGKTSIIEYIGKKIGQKILRINNNQNTEIEEYIGNYTTDSKGQFYFQEGFLVKAVREGFWIILDEINLAPSEVLESLNRLLDDNRELFISELNTTIQAHPNFKIFAAMNPSEMYAGRKDLSEAFKNRFIHLYFDNIPEEDLGEIIEKRCKLPKSRVDIMVQIFNDLQKIRSSEAIFSKKEGFITIRDLLKWGSRDLVSYDDLAYEGYFVIAEKLRNDEERGIVKKTIEKHLHNKAHMNFDKYFDDYISRNFGGINELITNHKLCLNRSTKRMLCLVDKCLKNKEPVLLIGETGTGKTVVCEYLAEVFKKKMITISCHENVDTGDFLGSLRSVYGREEKISQIKNILTDIFTNRGMSDCLDSKFNDQFDKFRSKYFSDNTTSILTVKDCEKLSGFLHKSRDQPIFLEEDKENIDKLNTLIAETHKLFEWIDGPLTVAMKQGDLLIIDEISLALDSVLERMNSVFEADRVLVLSENHTKNNVEIIHPDEGFMVIATMNPSGDHGKRELSPALRSRFSEIFVDTNLSKLDLEKIYEYAQLINQNFEQSDFSFLEKLNETDGFLDSLDVYSLICFKIKKSALFTKFSEYQINHTIKLIFSLFVWYNYYLISNQSLIVKTLTLRDVDMIVDFITANLAKINNESAFISIYNHSVHMTLIDGVFLNESSKPEALIKINQKIIEFTNYQTKYMSKILLNGNDCLLNEMLTKNILIDESELFGVVPFIFQKFPDLATKVKFVFHTDNIKINLTKILRGLTTGKPIIIEGSPGVGKTTIIQNLAKKLGRKIYRINLSEHTDMIDLIGSEYPTDENSSKGITFKWVDGVFLKALINGDWIIIDEMNLASQSILEGLNSVLDHRKSLFVSELSKEFKCHPNFQIFATQNPVNQGGGRKFLPKSFLNRFVKIYLNDLSEEDYKEIMKNLFPSVQEALIDKLTQFNYLCQNLLFNKHKLNMNEVGEFNLRTLIKILEIVSSSNFRLTKLSVEHIMKLMYVSRIRIGHIRKEIRQYLKETLLEVNEIIWENETPNQLLGNFESITSNKYSIPYLDCKSVPIKLSPVMKYSDLLVTCIENNFPLIITGHSGIGKKEIIRFLANNTNNKLFEFGLNSSMDSTELLGNFDKINLSYHLKIFKEKISTHIMSINFDTLTTFQQSDYLQLLSLIDLINRKLHNMKESLEVLKEKLKALNIYSLYEENVAQIEKVTEFILTDTFNFEWHDSILINCIINGYWIILDNVNTCSSAVLDRLNSLLDDDKQIYLNESGVNDGRVIKPHKNFRIFMIMNEKYGEVSRALKNRCVEIYFDKKILNIDNKIENINRPDFNLSIREKLVTVNYSDKSIVLRRKSFDDHIALCENLRLFNYNLSLYTTVVYLLTVSTNVIDYRLFKKYFTILDKYYSAETAENKYNLTEALTKTISLLSIRSEFAQINIGSYIGNLVKSLNNKREIINEKYTGSNDLLNSCQTDIYNLRAVIDLNLGSDTVSLVDKFSGFEKYISMFQNDFNKLIAKSSYYMDIIRNIDSIEDDCNKENETKRYNNLANFNKILFKISNDKIFHFETLSKMIYSNDTSDEEIKIIIRDLNYLRKYISEFNSSFCLFIIYSFLKLKSTSEDRNKILILLNSFNSNSNEKDEISYLKNIFLTFMKSSNMNVSQSATEAMNRLYFDKLNNKNVEKQIKKLINSREEDRISSIFSEISNLGRSAEDCILFASLVDFLLDLINKDDFMKFIQTNSESFLFVFESLIENFSTLTKKDRNVKEISQFKNIFTKMKKMCENLNSQQSDSISKSIFFLDHHNTNMQFRFNPSEKSLSLEAFTIPNNSHIKSDILNFDLSLIFNLNSNQYKDLIRKIISNKSSEERFIKLDNSPMMNMILLEFDLKSAKTFQDVLNIKNYYSFTEKVNEILTNEKLMIPVISNKVDMLNVQIFIENIIKYTNYMEDYDYSTKELFYSFEDLTELNYLQKHQKKSGLDTNLIKFLLNAHINNNESLQALSLDLVNLLILNEYSAEKTIEKVNYISNISQSLISHFVNNYKKLFFIPFYFFYCKTVTENIISNFSKIVGMNKLGRKIKLFERVLTDLQNNLFDNPNVLEVNKSSSSKLEKLENHILHAELIATLSIPNKKTISKILGKDLFKLFYEILIKNKEKNMFADKLVFELENSSSSSFDYKSEEAFKETKSDDMKIFEYLLRKVEKLEKDTTCISTNYDYDNFVKSLSSAIEKFLIIKSNRENDTITANQREEFKLSLKSLIDNHMNTFSYLILPFALSSLVYCSALNEKYLYLRKEKKVTKYFLDKVEYLGKNFEKESEKMVYSFLYKSENLSHSNLMIDILQNKLDDFNKRKELEAETKLSENQNEFFSFREKLKLYETVNMRVLETTQALDETTQAVRDKMKEEEELKEIEENFPTYQNDFKNFDQLELIDLTKNINIKDFYNNKKETDSNAYKGKDILYYTYLILKNNIVDINDNEQSKKDLGFSLPITSDYYHTVLFSKITNTEGNTNRENMSICHPYNNLELDLSFILEHQYKFYKLKSNEGFSVQGDQADIDIEEGFSNLKKQNSKAATSNVIYNFYKDPNPREIRYLYIVLNKLLERLSIYLKDHQDHPLLILILIITFNLLELDINSTPLSKVLSGLDVLLTKLKEWETYASKRINSMEEDIKSVMVLIRRFRKIEIVSWRGLLNSKMKEYERKDCLEYFNTVYKIFIHESLNKNTDEISDTINLFVLNSNFASFEFRINCLKIFSTILSKQKDFNNSELINCLLNIYTYYNNNFLLSGKLEEYKSLQLAEIEGKVKDLINIAKWDIKNYFNFRDNMKRNYKQLNKILKNFDNFCLTNIKEFIEYSSKDFISKDYILTKFVPSAPETEAKDYFDCFSLEIFSRIDSLRKLASNSNGSDRKDKIFKQKALLDLIKTLKNLGLSTIYKFYQNEVYNQFKKFNLDFIENYKSIVDPDFYYSILKSSSYVTKILDKINNFNMIDIVHEDLNNKYLDTMKGISFSSFFKSLSAYTKIQDCVKVYSDLVRKSHVTLKIADSLNVIVPCAQYTTWINLINEFLICFNKKELNLQFDSAGYLEKNKSLIEKFETLKLIKRNFEEFLAFNISKGNNSNLFLASEEEFILNEFVTSINNLITKDIWTQINSDYEITGHNFKGIVKEIASCKDSLIVKAEMSDEIMSVDTQNTPSYKINETYSTYITKKLELLALADNSNKSNIIAKIFDDFSLIEEKEEMTEENEDAEINIDDFLNKIGKVQEHYSALLHSENISHSLPNEVKTLSYLLKQSSDLMHSLLKLTSLSVSIFYNVSVNGFCQPTKTSSDNKGENDKGGVHEGGFGMSEGEGMEDISKQIEDEEQLLGLKEEKLEDAEKQDKKDGPPIDKNSGFEVKADFKEDKMEEIPEDEEEEKNKKEEEDDNLEREKDEVDDARGNQMYDKDNEIEGDNEEEDKSKEKGNVDLTDKNVSMKNQEKDNDYKSKDESRKEDKEKNVEKPEEIENNNNNQSEDENENQNDTNQKEEGKKIEKLDVNKNDGEDDKDSKQGDEDQMDIEVPEDKLKEVENNQEDLSNANEEEPKLDKDDQMEGKDEDLFGDQNNENKMEVEEDNPIDKNEEEAEGEEGESKQRGGEEPLADDVEEVMDKEELFKSNPIATKNEDLGYNPISNNKGSGGNTAERSKENKDKDKNENNDNINEEQLESLEKYDEIFDLNSMLESVWQTRPSKQDNRKRDVNKSVKQEKKETMQNDDKTKQDQVENDFDFHNHEEEEKEQINQKENEDFDMGYADNKNDKKASGFDENKNDMKDDQKASNVEEDQSAERNIIFNDQEEKIEIEEKVEKINIEGDEKSPLSENDNMDVESSYQSEEEEENVDMLENNPDGQMERTKREILIEMDKQVENEEEITTNHLDNPEDNEQTLEKLKKLESEMLADFQNWSRSGESSNSIELWNKLEQLSTNHINKLVEHLKIAMEPNKQTKLRGNYKSGKRLNIKKIISFIASNYRNDKIWLRRTLPFERNYYVMLAIDDSLSMKEHNLGFFALESLVIVSTALNKAGIGKLCICSIKEDMEVYHNYNEMFNKEKGAFLLSKFKFDFSSRLSHDLAMTNFMKNSMAVLENLSKTNQNSSKMNQIVFILSDGRFNKDNVRSHCIEAREKGLLYVFIILDKYGIDNNHSILNMNSVKHVTKPNGEIDIDVKPYLDDFPFAYYVIVEDSSDLPEVVHTILVKWFTLNN